MRVCGVARIACCRPAQASARVAKRRDWPATLRDHGHGTMRPLRRMPLSCKATA
jgi:hypothetical protein